MMAKSGSDGQTRYLSTSRAAKRLNLSEGTVRDLCKRGLLPGAYQEDKRGRWYIPAEAVEGWKAKHTTTAVTKADSQPRTARMKPRTAFRTTPIPGPPAWWERFRYNPWVFYSSVTFGILITLITLGGVLISAGADIGPARQQLQEWGWVRQFSAATADETLILIATFYQPEGVADRQIHREILLAIQKAAAEVNLSNFRVAIEPTRLLADDRAGAEALGKWYNASMIIWGTDTGVRVTVNYLNLKQPDFTIQAYQINETQRTQLANPSEYAKFVITEVPAQFTFLSLFAAGHSYYNQAQYAEAIPIIEKAVTSLPSGVNLPEGVDDAYFVLGWLYQQSNGDLKQIIDNYTKAIELNPNHVVAYNNRGNAYSNSGDLKQALQDYTKAIELNSNYALSYNNRGVAYSKSGDLKQAIQDFNTAIELNPNFAEAYNNRGGACSDSGDREQALQDYNKAIELKPDDEQIYTNRGKFYFDAGDPEQALQDHAKAIELNPNFAAAYNNRGIVYGDSGDLEQALQNFNKAIELSPNEAAAYANRGKVYDLSGNMEQALQDYAKAIELDPNLAEIYLNRGETYYKSGDLEQAIQNFTIAIELNPNFREAYLNRGDAYQESGDLEQALQDYTKTIELSPNEVEAYNNRGIAYADSGNLEQALQDFNKALELAPNLAEAYANRGKAYGLVRDVEQALQDFNKALELNPNLVQIYNNRGNVYADSGDLEQALEDFEKYLELVPDAPDRDAVLGRIEELKAKLE